MLSRQDILHITYIESLGNYVSIHYTNKKRELKRISLKALEQLLIDTAIIRVHNKYIVSLNYVISKSGNAQGYQLKVSACQKTIPVSRKHIAVFNKKYEHITAHPIIYLKNDPGYSFL